jgi:hypothetical protein
MFNREDKVGPKSPKKDHDMPVTMEIAEKSGKTSALWDTQTALFGRFNNMVP